MPDEPMQIHWLGPLAESLLRDVQSREIDAQIVALLSCLALGWILGSRAAAWLRRRGAGQPVVAVPELEPEPASPDFEPGVLGAAGAAQRAAHAVQAARQRAGATARSALRRVLAPAASYTLLALATGVLARFQSTTLLRLAMLLLAALISVRLLVFLVARLSPARSLAAFERAIGFVVWVGVGLRLTGYLAPVIDVLNTIVLPLGVAQVTLWQILSSLFWIALTVLVAYWVGTVIEARLLAMQAVDVSLRAVVARLVRALLLVGAVLLGLSLVGIDVTALSVFGGALGVGIGLGLQRIASNYVSGFIILLERSVRPGDVVRIGELAGTVSAIRTRYSVIRSGEGVEIIVPNEVLTTQTVHNVTTGGRLRLSTKVQVAYGSDPARVIATLVGAAAGRPRVLAEPAPAAYLSGFGADGLDFELIYHISEPQTGRLAVVSDVNQAVYSALNGAGFSIPYPQRDVRVLQDRPG